MDNTPQHQSLHYRDGLEVVPLQGIEVQQEGLEPYLSFSPQQEKPDNRIETLPYQNSSRNVDQILGLRKRNFWLLLAFISLVVIGASVGGSVGGALVVKNNGSTSAESSSEPSVIGPSTSSIASSESTSTTTTLSATPTVTSTTDCPGSDLEIYSPIGGNGNYTFKKYCTMKFSGEINLVESRVATFNDCIDMCANYNYWQGTSDCQGAAYEVPGPTSGNCWAMTGNLIQNGTARKGSYWAILL